MNASSERLVVFVTPAQKRVLAARAARMGISLSELVQRAVLAFDDTGEEMRAAGLVDRLGAARSRTDDSDALRRLAAGQAGSGEALQQRGPGGDRAPAAADPDAARGEPAPAGALDPSKQAKPSSPADSGVPAAIPVAAAVARALAAQAEANARPHPKPDPDDEALVARVIANESRDLSGF